MTRFFMVAIVCVFLMSAVAFGQTANHIVISECAPGGGSSNASSLYQRDWIELYNPTNSSVDITGWSLQYKSAAGTGTYAVGLTFGSVSIAPHSFYLIVSGAAGTGGAVLSPAADVDAGTGNLSMGAASGRLALCSNNVALTSGSEAAATTIVDFIGWGSGVTYSEGMASAPAGSISVTLERKAQATSTALTLKPDGVEAADGNGYDSNNNAADFVAQGSPTPQNSASPAEIPSMLPVEMTSFTAQAHGTMALLRWTTATELNNHGFDIEKNVNGSWTKLGFVTGNGTSNVAHEYSYVDAKATGSVSYRLKQIDNDGAFKYSDIASVEATAAPKAFEMANNYPNPFNPATEIRFAVPENGMATLVVYNALGQEVATLFNGMAQAGQYITATFNAGHLASGVYIARLQYAGKSLMQKMMLAK